MAAGFLFPVRQLRRCDGSQLRGGARGDPIPGSGLGRSLREPLPAVSGNCHLGSQGKGAFCAQLLNALSHSSQQPHILQLRKARPKATELLM